MKVWVCAVRKEAFVGGESQRCRHVVVEAPDPLPSTLAATFTWPSCGEMELIGGEPIEWCVVHNGWPNLFADETHECTRRFDPIGPQWRDPCQFESQIRVGP